VSVSRSLLPLTSQPQSAKRSPRYSASPGDSCWIIVPIAPSMIRTRSRRSAASSSVRSGWMLLIPCLPRREASLVFRSEEHTSELQSRENLVCRLLLDKKKGKNGFIPNLLKDLEEVPEA